MKVRVEDIPAGGLDLHFFLDKSAVSKRAALANSADESELPVVSYFFSSDPEVTLHVEKENSSVVLTGEVKAEYASACARCAEEAKVAETVPVDLLLKRAKPKVAKPQKSSKTGRAVPLEEVEEDELEEDLHFGTFSGEEVDLSEIAEEFLMLSLPVTVYCQADCKGLCPKCGRNLNLGPCDCQSKTKAPTEEIADPRLAPLKSLRLVDGKIVH